MLLKVTLAIAESVVRDRVRDVLARSGVVVANLRGDPEHLWRQVSRDPGDVAVLCTQVLHARRLPALRRLRAKWMPLAIVIVAAETVDAPLATACDAVIPADVTDTVLHARLDPILRIGKAAEAITETPQLSDFVIENPVMRKFMEEVQRVVHSRSTLLILGETGTGKERLARAIHNESSRADAPFVAVNCGAFPEGLLESELFGHVEGAFTGATRLRRGCFEMAHGGTIFLDEIAEMPLAMQVKLLRVLQDRVIQRVGDEKPIAVDVRIMAASNRDIEEERRRGRFRDDLHYRLSVVTLTIPPLRERREDIPVLARRYVEYLRPRTGRNVRAIDDRAMAALIAYSWPGNIRELANVLERAMLLSRGDTITVDDLTHCVRSACMVPLLGSASSPVNADALVLPEGWTDQPWRVTRDRIVAEVERRYLSALLTDTHGRIAEAAQRAGMDPRSLFEKMQRHNLRKEDFR